MFAVHNTLLLIMDRELLSPSHLPRIKWRLFTLDVPPYMCNLVLACMLWLPIQSDLSSHTHTGKVLT